MNVWKFLNSGELSYRMNTTKTGQKDAAFSNGYMS
jgi:hypothetical protein